jgi:TPR repeat protein
MYENEKGVKKDNQEALKWFKTAAEKGHVRAQVYLGRIYTQQQNLDEAAKWLEKAASKGHIESKFLLGLILLRQEKSPGDTINAVKLISFAAASGNADAQYVFGTLLESGKGISRNPGMAFEWYRKASLQGHKKAEKRFKEMIKILKVKTTGGTKNE